MSALDFSPPVTASPRYEGLDLLSTAVLLLDASARVVHVNQSAELLFDTSRKTLVGQPVGRVLGDEAEIRQLVADAESNAFGQRRQIMELRRAGREPLHVQVTATAQFGEATPVVLEVSEIEQQLKVDREERQLGLTEANRQLLRNLAHEIKNPLGGVRGAAQLLESELIAGPARVHARHHRRGRPPAGAGRPPAGLRTGRRAWWPTSTSTKCSSACGWSCSPSSRAAWRSSATTTPARRSSAATRSS